MPGRRFTTPDPPSTRSSCPLPRPTAEGVVLSGRGEDGAEGLRTIRQRGGMALVEDPVRATEPAMPAAAVAKDDPEVLPIDRLSKRVVQFCSGLADA